MHKKNKKYLFRNLFTFKIASTVIFYKYYSLNCDTKKLNIYDTYGVYCKSRLSDILVEKQEKP